MASPSQADQAPEKETPNWLELPRELIFFIFSKLDPVVILKYAQHVCTTWRNICKEPSMWRSIDLETYGAPNARNRELKALCCQAVDRSCGGLEYINIEYFGTNFVIQYIADRSSSLRHLRLVSCNHISDNGLIEAIAKLPMLEVVEIFNFKCSREALEAIGRSCALLKTFKYSPSIGRCFFLENDVEAQAIATTMRELRHLHLFKNELTDAGLSAILDGCPHLEFLDLRRCDNIDLDGDLEKRCLDRIKVFRRPQDSTKDYEFGTSSDDEKDYMSGFEGVEYDPNYDFSALCNGVYSPEEEHSSWANFGYEDFSYDLSYDDEEHTDYDMFSWDF